MIQRVQSLYLLGAIAAAVLMFFFPVARFFTPEGSYEFFLTGIKFISGDTEKVQMIPVLMLAVLIIVAVLLMISVFLFRNRVKQMRVVAIAFLFNAFLIGGIFFFADSFGKDHHTTPNYQNLGTIMPIIILIMLLLANKAIRKDEMKMRKSQRIR